MKAMQRAATSIAESDAECAAGLERWRQEDEGHLSMSNTTVLKGR
jgi:hypothetical protein